MERDLVDQLDDLAASKHDDLSVAADAAEEIRRLRDFVRWVGAWTGNAASAYSLVALDGLFGMTRDRIAALAQD